MIKNSPGIYFPFKINVRADVIKSLDPLSQEIVKKLVVCGDITIVPNKDKEV